MGKKNKMDICDLKYDMIYAKETAEGKFKLIRKGKDWLLIKFSIKAKKK